jgi:preprotein translocase subunit SecF
MNKLLTLIVGTVLFLCIVGFIFASTPSFAAVCATVMLTWFACDIYKWFKAKVNAQ